MIAKKCKKEIERLTTAYRFHALILIILNSKIPLKFSKCLLLQNCILASTFYFIQSNHSIIQIITSFVKLKKYKYAESVANEILKLNSHEVIASY